MCGRLVFAHGQRFALLAISWAVAAGCHAAPDANAPTPADAPPSVPPPVAAPAPQLWLRAVGDVQLERGVERTWQRNDLRMIYEGVRSELRAADIAFGNLESVVAHSGSRRPHGIRFRAHPNVVLALADAGFDVMSLANNHADDYGPLALREAASRLRAAGIAPSGVRVDGQGERPPPAIVRRHGVDVAFLSFTEFDSGDAQVLDDAASRAAYAADIQEARALAPWLVVSVHWGNEYVHTPTPRQVELAHAAIDAGADLVIGHHPHWLQGVEVYRGKVIAYSLGNFIFDQPWTDTRRALMLDWRAGEGGVEARLLPIAITPEPFRTRMARDAEAETILSKAAELSLALGTASVREPGALRLDLGAAAPAKGVAERSVRP